LNGNPTGGSSSYKWDFGDGSISTKKNPIYTYSEAGVYAVVLRVSGPGGSDTCEADIEIWPTPNLYFKDAPDSVSVYVWKEKGKYTNGKIFFEVGDVTLLQ
jgi:PKD repeat protein